MHWTILNFKKHLFDDDVFKWNELMIRLTVLLHFIFNYKSSLLSGKINLKRKNALKRKVREEICVKKSERRMHEVSPKPG